MNEVNVLIVVEGKRAEPNFFNQIKRVYNINFNIYCLETNIYRLYREMKKLDFNGNLKDVLLSLHNTDEYKEVLHKKFAFTYLIFDFDPHHTEEYEKNKPIEEIVSDNIQKINDMTEYFIDETDPTVGRLYINYPMLESYRDCDTFFDENYINNYVDIQNIREYKKIAGTKKLANIRIDKSTQDNFESLSKMNLYKLSHILFNKWKAVPYSQYRLASTPSFILSKEAEIVTSSGRVAVLNTSLFLLLDYYGNRNGFYDKVINKST